MKSLLSYCSTTFAVLFCCLVMGQQADVIYTNVDTMPKYPGGDDSLLTDIRANVLYPKNCLDSGFQGKVFLRFVVNIDGAVSEVSAVKGPHPDLNKAVTDAVYKIKRFSPGIFKGQEVRTWYNASLNFKLQIINTSLPHNMAAYTAAPQSVFPDVEKSVDVLPVYPGGDLAIKRYLEEHLHYPRFERINCITGGVLIRFVVLETGMIADLQILRGVSPGLDSEAIRVLRTLPSFSTPAYLKGNAVKVFYTLPVYFNLEDCNPEFNRSKYPDLLLDYYPGGQKGFQKFISEAVVYPETAKTAKVEAELRVVCKIDSNNKLVALKVINDADSSISIEAKKVISRAEPFQISQHPELRNELHEISILFTLNPFYLQGSSFYTRPIDKKAAEEFNNSGVSFTKSSKYKEALEQFEKAIAKYSLYADAYYNIGVCKAKLNDPGSCDAFKRAYLLGDLDAESIIKKVCH